ncbi:Peroxisome proliferation transcriptional regulator [Cytospora mali]|uniref:Peroxisome proliferation transcriptional regulator n=1 Tax=Cytospora mali TaxID=578113 RepID=A0A194VLH6_CYTMA|nr:Peroxisome proliferation transcriptional regulator [Valsa mali]
MDLTLESKACGACAKAKRKCDRQIPTCGRCQSRETRCDYATATPSLSSPPNSQDAIRVGRGEQSFLGTVSSTPTQVDVLHSPQNTSTLFDLSGEDNPILIDDLFRPTLNISFPSSVANLNPKVPTHHLPWYLEPNTWDIDHLDASEYGPPICSQVLNIFIEDLQGWLATWVNTGTCPFIHSRIYKHQIPRCVQDAYTTLSTYQNKTSTNKAIITGMIEERMKQLLEDQPTPTSVTDNDNPSVSSLTPFEHLARVHALMVYQTVSLYDGDIRLRHVAETQIPTLNSWLRLLVNSAQSAAQEGSDKFISSLLYPPSQKQPGPNPGRSPTNDFDGEGLSTLTAGSILSPEDIAWYAWLFAETIRRTWLIACSMQTIYLTLQLGWAPCPGGLPLTARDGLFSAGSAFAWASRCEDGWEKQGAGADFIRRRQANEMLEKRTPKDMDLFATRMFEMQFGLERVQRWRLVKGSKE